MPIIKIQSLPVEPALDIPSVLLQIADEFSQSTGIEPEHISITWNFLTPGHYVNQGKTSEQQLSTSHPLLVELLVPDFNPSETIDTMLRAIAKSLSRHSGISENNIFIHCHLARSGFVFDSGEIVRW